MDARDNWTPEQWRADWARFDEEERQAEASYQSWRAKMAIPRFLFKTALLLIIGCLWALFRL